MEPSERVHLRETCVVPCRLTALGIEFCLVSPVTENRWEFPKIIIDAQNGQSESLLHQAAAVVGLRGDLLADEPLGQFDSTRGNEARSMIGYLMRVTSVDETWFQQANYRRRWCLAEEARARIRRKPLRRFIDVALHSVEFDTRRLVSPKGPPNGRVPGRRPT
ncbi:MAG: hypothetical protein HY288_07140 [Planctomycetia bacterium]|nr:hypothetical protein [Planctomycetia bacterium]